MPIPVWIMEFPVLDAGLIEIAAIILTILIVLVLRSPGMIFRAVRDHIDTVSQLREMMEITDFWKEQYETQRDNWSKLFHENLNIDAYGCKYRQYADVLLNAAAEGLAHTPEWHQMRASLKEIQKLYSSTNPTNPFNIMKTEDPDQLYHLRQLHHLELALLRMEQSETKKQIPA